MNSRIRTRTLGWIAVAWTTLVSVVLIWQTVEYRGVVGWLAEWQFRMFDRFFPVATVALLVLLLVLPFVILILLRLRKSARNQENASLSRMTEQAGLVGTFINFGIFATGVASLLLLGLGLMQGSISDKPVNVKLEDLGDSAAQSTLPDGQVSLRGTVLYDRMGFYREGFVFTSRELWVAPFVVEQSGKTISTFVQVKRAKAGSPEQEQVSGYFKKRSVPGGLAQLYVNAGYEVADRPSIIYADMKSVRWPYLSAAADFAFLLLFLSIAGILHRRHAKRLSAADA